MKITGSAPKIAIPTFIYLGMTILIDYLYSPFFRITGKHYSVLVVLAVMLIVPGIAIVAVCGKQLLSSFKGGVLMTGGLYGICRNPMYAAYLVFIIPGICLLLNSWLVLSTVLINYILLQIFIKDEYRYLEEKFGEEYRAYLDKVWIKRI